MGSQHSKSSVVNIAISPRLVDNYVENMKKIQCYDDGMRKEGFVGLTNLGATGYINSVLYQLFMIKQFRFGIISAGVALSKLSRKKRKMSVLFQLFKLFSFLSLSTTHSYDTTDFCNAYKHEDGQSIAVTKPGDADRFLNNLLFTLQNELKGGIYEYLVEYCFHATIIRQYTMCKGHCNAIRQNINASFSISLRVADCTNIQQSLEEYIKEEIFEIDRCPHCQQRTSYSIHSMICSLSNVLFFALGIVDGEAMKLNTRYEYPQQINLKQYMTNNGNQSDDYYEYELVGTVVHNGSAQCAKYYSFIKNRNFMKGLLLLTGYIRLIGFADLLNTDLFLLELISSFFTFNEWIYVNDDNVKSFDIKHLDRESFGGYDSMKNANILIYERRKFLPYNELFHVSPWNEHNYLPNNGLFDINGIKDDIKKTSIWNDILNDIQFEQQHNECHWRKCNNTKIICDKFYKCTDCMVTKYCSKHCQKLDWKYGQHPEICSKLV